MHLMVKSNHRSLCRIQLFLLNSVLSLSTHVTSFTLVTYKTLCYFLILSPVNVVFQPVKSFFFFPQTSPRPGSDPLSVPWGWLCGEPLWWWRSPLRQPPPRPRRARGPAECECRWARTARSRWLCGGHSDSWWPGKPAARSWRGALSPGPTSPHVSDLPGNQQAKTRQHAPSSPRGTPLSWEKS